MKKKNVILMASLSLFAMNCSTLQENLSSKKGNNKVKTLKLQMQLKAEKKMTGSTNQTIKI